MQLKTIYAVLACAAIASIFVVSANAQPDITWQTPVTISGASDVNTSGTYFGSWAPQDGGANNHPVNGVTFQGFSDLPGLTPGGTFDNGYDGFGSPNTSDANYNTLLQFARFSNEGTTPATFTWSGMTPGNTYLIQLWVNDGRMIGESRTETVTGGANTSAPLSYGSDGSGPGQYIIGTFVADSSRTQTLTLTAFSSGASPSPQINLFQVRDITPRPTVTWQTPVTISSPTEVSTVGTYFGSWAPQDGSANTLPVNGVTFQGFSDLPFFTSGPTFDSGYDSYGSPNTSDSNYNTLLKFARYSNLGTTPATISWSGMTPGNTYLIQFWVNDGRSIGETRTETITGGANTSAALSYGSDGSGPGQYIIGTFVANSSGGQTLILNAFSSGANPSPQVNLLQVRDITPRPNVTWQTPVTISSPTEVSTVGTYFGSWAPQDGSANTLPVNGVTFQGFSDLPFFTSGPTFDSGYDSYGSPNTSDSNYNTLLKFARYSNSGTTPATISWSGMTPGNTYLIQFWVNDGRNIGQSRTETVTGGANTSASLSFGSDGTGPGQYVTGTFVANSSGGQTLILNAFSSGANPSPQVNLLQVRDITATLLPAPTITGIRVSGTTLTIRATNGPANGPYVLLESATVTLPLMQWTPVFTNSFDGNGAINLSTNVVNPSNHQQFYILRTQP